MSSKFLSRILLFAIVVLMITSLSLGEKEAQRAGSEPISSVSLGEIEAQRVGSSEPIPSVSLGEREALRAGSEPTPSVSLGEIEAQRVGSSEPISSVSLAEKQAQLSGSEPIPSLPLGEIEAQRVGSSEPIPSVSLGEEEAQRVGSSERIRSRKMVFPQSTPPTYIAPDLARVEPSELELRTPPSPDLVGSPLSQLDEADVGYDGPPPYCDVAGACGPSPL
ncbi:hypothetical protein C2S53_002781 [Perilla frutescens var. hirtella]|uniref:Uncharacterized protein n=1 Tax=Perilla frutescens var. hirtella TaxID=608512 RepID=A0AAD4IQF9_PERFH|nr:hypothetical protein C2S53_002781 [Perilla frutescens var. hirtella]